MSCDRRSSSRLFASLSRKKRAFWIATIDWVAKVCSSSVSSGENGPGVLRRTTSAPTI